MSPNEDLLGKKDVSLKKKVWCPKQKEIKKLKDTPNDASNNR